MREFPIRSKQQLRKFIQRDFKSPVVEVGVEYFGESSTPRVILRVSVKSSVLTSEKWENEVKYINKGRITRIDRDIVYYTPTTSFVIAKVGLEFPLYHFHETTRLWLEGVLDESLQ